MRLKKEEFNILVANKIKQGMDKQEAYEQTRDEVKVMNENKPKGKLGRPKKSFKEEFAEIKKEVTNKIMRMIYGI